MADVFFCRSRNSNCYWVVGETNAGKKFIRDWFDSVPGYIILADLELFVDRAKEADLNVEVNH